MLGLIFLVAAFICAVLAALVIPNPPPGRPQLGWLAFALFLASLLCNEIPKYGH